MSPLVAWLVLTLLVCVSAQDINNDQILDEAEDEADSTPYNDPMETATDSSMEDEHSSTPQKQNRHRNKWPGLKVNPPDFVPFPRKSRVTQFWRDHPDFRAIPDLPAKDIEYPKWLIAVMGPFHTTTLDPLVLDSSKIPSIGTTEVNYSNNRQSKLKAENLNPSTLPNKINSTSEGNNLKDQTRTRNTELILQPKGPIEQPFLNSGIQNAQPVPTVIPRQSERDVNSALLQHQYRPILFRIPFILGLKRIWPIPINNSQRNPNYLAHVSDNRSERRQPASLIEREKMLPNRRQNFRRIPMTISRSFVVDQPRMLMLTMRNRNMQSRFRQPRFLQRRPLRRIFPINQNRPQNPSFDRHNSIAVDPHFSRNPLSMAQHNQNRPQNPSFDRHNSIAVDPHFSRNPLPMAQRNQNRPQNPSFDKHNSIAVDPHFSRNPLSMAQHNQNRPQNPSFDRHNSIAVDPHFSRNPLPMDQHNQNRPQNPSFDRHNSIAVDPHFSRNPLSMAQHNQNRPQNPSFDRHNSIAVDPRFSRNPLSMAQRNQNRPQNPSFDKHNSIAVDPHFSRNPLSMAQHDNSQRIFTPVTNQRKNFQEPGKPKTPIQSNRSATFLRRPWIRARNKRQSDFQSFEPFGRGNIFSFFPQDKEPRNSFTWFPRESIMNIPTRQSPINSGGFIPRVNSRPTKKQTWVPQDAWGNQPTSSNNLALNYPNQNSQRNHQPNNNNNNNNNINNREIPEDFMIIRPNKAASHNSRSNQVPWMINNLFGSDLFPDNGDHQMWTIQNPSDRQPGTHNNQQPLHVVNQVPYPNNARTRPYHEETISPPYNRQSQFQPPVYQPVQNFDPNRGHGHHSHIDNSMRRPSNQLPSQINRNDINQGAIQSPSHVKQSHGQPQEKWRPASQRPVKPQVPVSPHGVWIPKKNTQKKTSLPKSNHFHEVPRPHYRQPQHQKPHHSNDHLKEQPSSATNVPIHTGRNHQTHRTKFLPEIQKGKRKLSPSQVRHLLSLLPEFPKEVYKKPTHKGHAAGNRQKRNLNGPPRKPSDNKDDNLTQNHPGLNEVQLHKNKSNVPHLHSSRLPITERKKRGIKEGLIRNVLFRPHGYHYGNRYQDGSYSDFPSPFFGYMTSDKLGNDISGDWRNMFNSGSHHFLNGWDWTSYGYYGPPHHGFGHLLHGHGAIHPHPGVYLGNYWIGNIGVINDGGSKPVVVIPPAVPRANPNQLSYTARFRYRFGIYPGYSDFIPGTDNHKIFFFYNDKQKPREPDAVVPFRMY